MDGEAQKLHYIGPRRMRLNGMQWGTDFNKYCNVIITIMSLRSRRRRRRLVVGRKAEIEDSAGDECPVLVPMMI